MVKPGGYMSAEFEFQVKKNFHFLSAFAKHFSAVVEGDKVHLPAWLGDGYIQHIPLDSMGLFIHNYILKQDLILRRQAIASTESITLKFDRSKFLSKYSQHPDDPFLAGLAGFEVEIGTCNFNNELKVPAGKQINLLLIGTSRSYLTGLLNTENHNTISDLVTTHPSFVMYDLITPEMDSILKQIIRINHFTELPLLLYRTKAQELIYHLFKNLFNRPASVPVDVKPEDAEKINLVRLALLKNLHSCPLLPELAALSGLGLTQIAKALHTNLWTKYSSVLPGHAHDTGSQSSWQPVGVRNRLQTRLYQSQSFYQGI